MSKKKALGRGLAAILHDSQKEFEEHKKPNALKESNSIHEINIESIAINPFQPRTNFEKKELQKLASSIKELGIIQPITVRKLKKGNYQLISGERRVRASKIAGIKKIPAFIRSANDDEVLQMALVENIQRRDLNPIEIALSFKRLIKECGLTQESCSKKVGKNRTTVTNFLRLLKLPEEIQMSLQKNKISIGHARALINIKSLETQLNLHRDIITNGFSVREVEQLAREFSDSDYKKISKNKYIFIPENIPFSQQKSLHLLSKKLGIQIQIKRSKKGRGSLTFSFSSDKDLERILKKLMHKT